MPTPRIQPGTVIDKQPAAPWTHLVIKSIPRASKGEFEKMSARDRRYSSLLATVMTAQVKPAADKKYHLTALGIGCATLIKGKHTVISPTTQKQLGARFGILQSVVLDKFYKQQNEVVIKLKGKQVAVIDAPVVARINNVNQKIFLRHVVLVNPDTGHVDNLIWMIEPNEAAAYGKLNGKIELLRTNHIEDCELYVDTSQYVFGIPTENAFAIECTPKGQRTYDVPKYMMQLATKQKFAPEDGAKLELSLRALLRQRVAQRSVQ